MNLSKPFISRPVMTILCMLSLLMLGIMAYNRLPVSNLPDVDYPVINVSAALTGASPETMANTVATPLEKEFMTIPGLELVTSSNTLGSTDLTLIFKSTKSIDSAAQDVQAALARASNYLPQNLSTQPSYEKVNPSNTPILYLTLTSDTLPLSELYTYGNTYIGKRLASVDGVAQVTTFGSPYAVRIQVDPNIMANLGITLQEVSNAIKSGNVQLPTGQINGNSLSSIIVAQGQLTNAKEYGPLIVAYRNNAPVRIQDIGQTTDSLQDVYFRLKYVNENSNKKGLVIAVQRQPGANTVAVAEAIDAYLPKLQAQLPPSVEMGVLFDRSQSIKESIFEVKLTLVLAFALVVLVIFLCLGRIIDTIIPAVVLPMSVITTFCVMYLLGFSINILSLLALVLSTGFMVDDAIVVLESIVRKIEEGENRWTAALEGTKQISVTVLTTTLSIVAVLIPLLFMGGLIGKLFREFAITLAVVNLASLFISITLTPMLCSRLLSKHDTESPGIFLRFSLWFNQKMLQIYEPILQWSFEHRKITLSMGALSIILSIVLFKALPADFLPEDDIGFIIAYNQAEQGTSPEKMYEYQESFIEKLQNDPNIESFISIAAFPQYHNGMNFIRLKPHNQRKFITDVISNLYNETTIPGLNTFYKNVPLIDLSIGASSKGAYQYTLQGLDENDLYKSAEGLMEKMKSDKNFQGVSSDLEIKTPQLNVEILRDRASTFGITSEQIQETLSLGYAGASVSRIQTPIELYDVILEFQGKYLRKPSSLSSIYLRSTTGNVVPLSVVTNVKEVIGVASINHVQQLPAVTIGFNINPEIPLSTALNDLNKIAKETLVPGINGSTKGLAETFEESMSNATFLLLMAIFAIYVVLGVLYESFIIPITILSSLPPAIFGALGTLFICGIPLSLYSFLGLILLVGIVQKNGIMMVDYALANIRQKNESPEKAIYEACMVRFRPIMMTTLTTLAGALPIAIGFGFSAAARRPLGLVIIGGLVVSQCITLLLTPVVYLYLEKFSLWLNPKQNS